MERKVNFAAWVRSLLIFPLPQDPQPRPAELVLDLTGDQDLRPGDRGSGAYLGLEAREWMKVRRQSGKAHFPFLSSGRGNRKLPEGVRPALVRLNFPAPEPQNPQTD